MALAGAQTTATCPVLASGCTVLQFARTAVGDIRWVPHAHMVGATWPKASSVYGPNSLVPYAHRWWLVLVVHLQGAVFVNWMRDGARGGDSPASREDRDDVARRLLALLHGQAQGQGGGGGEGVSSRPWQPAPLLLERDPDVYVPTFEARGLSMDMPVVVGDEAVLLLSCGSCRTAVLGYVA